MPIFSFDTVLLSILHILNITRVGILDNIENVVQTVKKIKKITWYLSIFQIFYSFEYYMIKLEVYLMKCRKTFIKRKSGTEQYCPETKTAL